jgi:hypothetical protein
MASRSFAVPAARVARRPLLGSEKNRADDVIELTAGRGRLSIDADVTERPAGNRPIASLAGFDKDALSLSDLLRLRAIFAEPALAELLDKAAAAGA